MDDNSTEKMMSGNDRKLAAGNEMGCPSWLFVGNSGDMGVAYFQDSKIGHVVGWRHGNNKNTLRMKPGHVAVIYITDGSKAEIRGLGIVLSVRKPFLLDTRRPEDTNAYVQRVPILLTDLFEEEPINAKDLESRTQKRLAPMQGSVHRFDSNNERELLLQLRQNGHERNAFAMNDAEKASAVDLSNLPDYLKQSAYLAFFESYITLSKRKKMFDSDETPQGDLAAAQVISAIADAWRTEGLPEIFVSSEQYSGEFANLPPVNDNPTGLETEDKLQRFPMAKILASRLRTVCAEMNADQRQHENQKGSKEGAGARSRGAVDSAPFTLLVDAPWGGGKTSFANFLSLILSEEGATSSSASSNDAYRPWTVVTFNAWRHQHVKPVWWVLYSYIFNALLWRRGQHSKLSAGRLWLSEKFWQLTSWTNVVAFVAWILACILALLVYKGGFIHGSGLDFSSGEAIGVIGLLALTGLPIVASFRGLVTSIGNSLNPGRATASANSNIAFGFDDPLERFRNHFRRTLARERTPVLLVIDDLDRCQSDFVVDLVQRLQTLLRSQNLFVLLLGDRSWIENCFNVEFALMDADAPKNWQSGLGRKYVEKALQMSLTLPRPTEEQCLALLQNVTLAEKNRAGNDGLDSVIRADGGPPQGTERETEGPATDATTQAEPGGDVQTEVVSQDKKQAVVKERWAEALDRIDSGRDEAAIQRSILDFIAFFPDNPRQIKRIINTISFYQAVAIGLNKIEPDDEDWEKFYVWIIAYLAFPDQWKKLSRDPALLTDLRRENNASGVNKEFLKLLDFEGGPQSQGNLPRETKITVEDIKKFTELIPPPS